jgi:hypothetical protein
MNHLCRHYMGDDRIRRRKGGYSPDRDSAETTEFPVRVQRCAAHGAARRLNLNRHSGYRVRARQRGG